MMGQSSGLEMATYFALGVVTLRVLAVPVWLLRSAVLSLRSIVVSCGQLFATTGGAGVLGQSSVHAGRRQIFQDGSRNVTSLIF